MQATDLKTFDHIVVGGSIRSGRVSQELQDYLTKNKDVLKDKIRGLFCVCVEIVSNQPARNK